MGLRSIWLAVIIVTASSILLARGDSTGTSTRVEDRGQSAALVKQASTQANHHVQAVVSAHELATQAGIEVLERGGTAADAAVAVAAALSVVEPWFSSALGGGTWGLYYDAETGEVTSLDGVGPTGSNATIADFADRAGDSGMHQANVPGAWDGWMLWLEHYGRLDLADVLEPAIRVARQGYPIGAEMADWLSRGNIFDRPSTARIYAPQGVLLQEGDIVHQHDLANTFEALIAAYNARLSEGRTEAVQAARDYYYRGPLAEAIVQFSDDLGGYLTLADFHTFEAAIVEPISIDYNDEVTVFQNPPNSQGITMLMALNIIKGFDLAALDPVDAAHVQMEAVKLAFNDRNAYVGDPARVHVPVDQLLSDAYAESQRQRIDMHSAMSWPIEPGLERFEQRDVGDTTTFHVVDGDGNAAAVTTSLGAQFFVIGDTGIHINNRMRFLALEDGNPNQLAPGYKVRHTSNPYMALRDGRPIILGGNTGVDTQPQAQVQQFLSIALYGMPAQVAVDAPRWVVNSFQASTYPYAASDNIEVETDFDAGLRAALEARGHSVVPLEGGLFGNAGVIVLSPDGLHADVGADQRNDTSAGSVIPAQP
jgi:gamma-glutamyltranspeptidase / glutathione hydrolase